MKIEIQASGETIGEIINATDLLLKEVFYKWQQESWSASFGTAQASAVVVKEED